MVIRWAFLIAIFFCAAFGNAQSIEADEYHQRDKRIKEWMSDENYTEAAREVTTQINYLKSVGAIDSLYRYAYDLGRSHGNAYNQTTGIAAIESLNEYIRKNDPDTAHWIEVLEDLSWIYYENRMTPKQVQTDEAYMELVHQYSKATPILRSTAHYNAGFNAMEAGNAATAIEHFRLAVEPLDPTDSASVKQLVNGYNALGAALWRNGNLLDAESSFQHSLEYISHMEDEYQILSNRSNCLGNLSLVAQDEGRIQKAEDYLKSAISDRKKAMTLCKDHYEKEQHHKHLIANYRNLASLRLAIGDYSRALEITEYLSTLQKKYMRPEDPSVFLTYESFGSIYLNMEEYDKAQRNIGIFLKYCEDKYGRESFHTAGAYRRMADIYMAKKDFPEAIAAFNETIEILESISGDGFGQNLPMTLIQRGKAYQQTGEQQKALTDLYRAAHLYTKRNVDFDPKPGKAFLTIAECYLHFGEIDSAQFYTDRGLKLLQDYEQYIKTSGQFQQNNPVLYLPEAYYLKAVLAKESGSAESAETSIEKAISLLRSTKNIFDGEDAQLSLYDAYSNIFDFAQDLYFESYLTRRDGSYLEKMFLLNEESRTLLLRRQLRFFGSIQYQGIPDSVVQKEQQLIGILSGRKENPDPTKDYYATEEQYDRLIEHIASEYPDYYRLRFEEESISTKQVQNELLGKDHSLLQYISTDKHLYALLITPDSIFAAELNDTGIDMLIDRYNLFIRQMELEPFAQVSVALYNMLIEPFGNKINTPNILIVPNTDLFSINFETLMKPASGGLPRYLIYDFNISYLLSATTALKFRRLNKQTTAGVLAFAPGFSDELKQSYVQQLTDSISFDAGYLRFIQQPFAVRAAHNITGIFSGQAFTGKAANESEFKNRSSQYGIIHLGTHAVIDNTSPMLSRLILAKESVGNLSSEDGYLHTYEIYNLSLRAELAVLTACETGVGKENKSEGVLSLSHSFAYAGCPSVVMSLWQIDEKTSSTIIENFYQHLAHGATKSEALRQAKLEYLAGISGELAAPYFWAGMVLVGNHEPIIQTANSNFWILFSILAAAVVGFFLIRKSRKKKGLI